LLLLGDIYFVPKNVELMFRIFEEQQVGAVLATKQEKNPEAIMRNFSVVENEHGRVMRVIEKPRHVTNDIKGVGLYLFDLSIFDAIRRTPRTAMRDEYEITEAIQVMIDDGAIVRAAEAVHDDINLTFPQDLLSLNLSIARAQPGENLIHADAIVHPDSKISNSVLGAGVRIMSPAIISNCLLFDDAVVANPGELLNAIVTPEMTIGCQPEPVDT
jgi:dTDP-glucose pyrophosphorylase